MRFPAILCAVLVLLASTRAGAQATSAASDVGGAATGEVEFGFRLTSGLDDVGRYQRFEDPRSGPRLDRLRYTREREAWRVETAFDNVGYRDQRYLATFERWGRVKASFQWDQIPTWYGGQTASPYRAESATLFRLDDGTQLAVQNRTATISAFAPFVESFDTRARRDVAAARFTYSATRNLDLNASFTSTKKSGTMPWSASFGFSDAVEIPVTVDHRTNDIGTSAEWSNRRGMVRLAYDGSFFGNGTDTLIWDNPLRATDQTTSTAYSTGEGSSQGRMPIWPDSSAHTVSLTGSAALPWRSRAVGYVSVGSWLQDGELLPHTINSAIAPIPLARQTADGEARIVSMMYRFTSRPTQALWFSGQYRLYDYDNRTAHFPVDQYVRLDGTVSTSVTGGSEPFGMTRHFVDLDASFTPSSWKFVALRAGYANERDRRTYRVFETTTEQIARASIDSTGFSWGTVRLQYDHSVRTGDGLDEEVLSDIGEQISLRQFDIANRTRDRVSAIVQVALTDSIGISGSLGTGRERRPDSSFGLQDNDLTSVTAALDVQRGTFGLGLSYAFDNLNTLQRSRQANPGPQFDDPTRDWSTTLDEHVHTLTTTLEVPRITDRISAQVTYDFVHSNDQYLYLLPADTTLPPVSQLPPVLNEYHLASATIRYALTKAATLAIGYRLDKYVVEDFGRSAETLDTPLIPTFVNVMYRWVPYDLHTAFARLMYRW